MQGGWVGTFRPRPQPEEAVRLLEQLVALEEVTVQSMWNVVATLLNPPSDHLLPNMRSLSLNDGIVPLARPLDPRRLHWLAQYRSLRSLSIRVQPSYGVQPPPPRQSLPTEPNAEAVSPRHDNFPADRSQQAQRQLLSLQIDGRNIYDLGAAQLVSSFSCDHLSLREAGSEDEDSLVRILGDLVRSETLVSLRVETTAWQAPYTNLSNVLTSFTSLQSLEVVRGIDLDTLVDVFADWPQHPPIVRLWSINPPVEPGHILRLIHETEAFGRLRQIWTEWLPFGDADLKAIRDAAKEREVELPGFD